MVPGRDRTRDHFYRFPFKQSVNIIGTMQTNYSPVRTKDFSPFFNFGPGDSLNKENYFQTKELNMTLNLRKNLENSHHIFVVKLNTSIVQLNLNLSIFENTVDPDQLASDEVI